MPAPFPGRQPRLAMGLVILGLTGPGAWVAMAPSALAAPPSAPAADPSWIGLTRRQVEARAGAPERVTPYQPIYNLPGQRPIQWLFYQRRGYLVGLDQQGRVRAVLYLPRHPQALPGGVPMGAQRQAVQQRIGAADHVLPEDNGTERHIHANRGLDLTFDRSSGRLVQALYFPELRGMRQIAPTPKPTARPSAAALRPKVSPTPTEAPPSPEPSEAPSPRPTPRPSPTPRPTPTPKPNPTPTPSPSMRPSPTPSPSLRPSPAPRPSPSLRPSPTPRPSPSLRPSPTPRPSPSLRPSPTPRPSPSPRPSPRPTPRPIPSVALRVPSPAPRPTPNRILPVVPNLPNGGASGPAMVGGQVSYFRSETGEILYLAGARIYLSREPLMASGGISATPAQAEALRALHRDRIAQLLRAGAILRGATTDKFGRFELARVPEGDFYVLGLADEFGRYLMWQRKVSLQGGRPERVYLNRNNLDVRTQ